MAGSKQLVVFAVDDQHYALDLVCVERVVRAVEVTHLPEAPNTVLGVINFEGRVIPVVNTRKRLGLPEKDLDLADLFIIARENDRSLALVGDDVRPVLEMAEDQVIKSEKVLPATGYVQGVAKSDEGMVIVLTVSRILSSAEHDTVRQVIEAM
jgi:purine-binding chemotaxis protein CheW